MSAGLASVLLYRLVTRSKDRVKGKYKRLVDLLLDGDRPDLVKGLIEVMDKPRAFFMRHSALFEAYDLDADHLPSVCDLQLLILAHGLKETHNFQMIDWCQANEDSLHFLNQILEGKGLSPLDLSEEDLGLGQAYDFLCLCGRQLQEQGQVLLELGRGNDAYEFFILDQDKKEEVMSLAKDLGLALSVMD